MIGAVLKSKSISPKSLLILVILIIGFLPSVSIGSSTKATVLIYHKFNEPNSPSTSISTEVFEKQITFLLKKGYNIISIDELVDALYRKRPFPEKAVVITIDDGYRTTYTEAFPVLKKYNLPFSVFLYMEGIGRFPAYMTVEQLMDMARYDKVTFGLHSYYHKPLGSITDRNFLEEDTKKAIKRFRKLFSFAPRYYAYPYGEYNMTVLQVIKDLGLEAAFTQDPFNVSPKTDPYLIPRVPMVGSWATLKNLQWFLQSETLEVSEYRPAFGVLTQNPPGRFVFTIEKLARYRDIRFYISELGWFKPMVNPEKSLVTVNIDRPLKRRINRVALEAVDRDSGNKARFFYLIVKP